MSEIFDKLNLGARRELVVLNPPESFRTELAQLPALHLHHHLTAVLETEFLLAFVTHRAEVDSLAAQVDARAKGDGVVWFAYPKGTSKRYQADFNRDTGWDALERLGWETVRAISIDENWTALRFRRRQFVKARAK